MDWQPIETAPPDIDLELSVIDRDIIYPLVFPCRRTARGWCNGLTDELVSITPTHWRYWKSME